MASFVNICRPGAAIGENGQTPVGKTAGTIVSNRQADMTGCCYETLKQHKTCDTSTALEALNSVGDDEYLLLSCCISQLLQNQVARQIKNIELFRSVLTTLSSIPFARLPSSSDNAMVWPTKAYTFTLTRCKCHGGHCYYQQYH
jgi:hypothetical protein